MGLLSLEHSKAAYLADFAVYGLAVAALTTVLVTEAPRAQQPVIFAIALAGLTGWSFVEYALHRFVLHGLEPFRSWHAEHHLRPAALICSPTIFSLALITALVILPALALAGPWRACALTLGVLTGYLAYAVTHHALHHWRADNPWLLERKRAHALHHHRGSACYGVTNGFWDRVLRSDGRARS